MNDSPSSTDSQAIEQTLSKVTDLFTHIVSLVEDDEDKATADVQKITEYILLSIPVYLVNDLNDDQRNRLMIQLKNHPHQGKQYLQSALSDVDEQTFHTAVQLATENVAFTYFESHQSQLTPEKQRHIDSFMQSLKTTFKDHHGN